MAINPEDAPDCVFHGESATGVLSELATDLSQWSDSISTATNCIVENESSSSLVRFNHRTTRTVEISFTAASSDTGVLFRHRQTTTGNSTQQLTLGASGLLTAVVNDSTANTYTIANWPGLGSATFIVCWTTEPNPLTTGASDAYRSELHIFQTDGSSYELDTFTHAQFQDSPAGRFLYGAQNTGGFNAFSGTILACRMCKFYHSPTETRETWVAQSSAPTLAGVERLPIPVLNRSEISQLDDGEYAGPAHAMAGEHVKRVDLALAGPIVNEYFTSSGRANEFTDPTSFTTYISDGTAPRESVTAYTYAQLAFYRPVMPWCNRARVRVFFQQRQSSGVPDNIDMYVFSSSHISYKRTSQWSPDSVEAYYVTETINSAHGSAADGGEWLEFTNNLKLARDLDGFTYILLGFSETTWTNEFVRIKAVCVTPIIDEGTEEPYQIDYVNLGG